MQIFYSLAVALACVQMFICPSQALAVDMGHLVNDSIGRADVIVLANANSDLEYSAAQAEAQIETREAAEEVREGAEETVDAAQARAEEASEGVENATERAKQRASEDVGRIEDAKDEVGSRLESASEDFAEGFRDLFGASE